MSYVFSNLSDEKLTELQDAIYEEKRNRFKLHVNKYPKLSLALAGNGNYTVEGIKAYREAYGLSLFESKELFYHYHRNENA